MKTCNSKNHQQFYLMSFFHNSHPSSQCTYFCLPFISSDFLMVSLYDKTHFNVNLFWHAWYLLHVQYTICNNFWVPKAAKYLLFLSLVLYFYPAKHSVWIFPIWTFRDGFVVKSASQILHWNGFFPSWTDLICLLRFVFTEKALSHTFHSIGNRSFPLWTHTN